MSSTQEAGAVAARFGPRRARSLVAEPSTPSVRAIDAPYVSEDALTTKATA